MRPGVLPVGFQGSRGLLDRDTVESLNPATAKLVLMQIIPIDHLGTGGHNVPVNRVDDVEAPKFNTAGGAARYRYTYPQNRHLDSLLLNKGASTLVVALHGALHRTKYELPRFEWLTTLLGYDVNSMYFTDPTLWMDEKIQLAWYAGWPGTDVQQHIANWIIRAAEETGSNRIVILGSSGGGFAALQISALVSGSICLPFNPSTHIHQYWVNGDPKLHGTERKFIEVVHPDAAPNGIWQIDWDYDWTVTRGSHLSVLRRYSEPVPNYVFFASNPNEWHFEQHYLPFLAAAARGDNLGRIKVWEYEGRDTHTPPRPNEFRGALDAALEWRLPVAVPPVY